MSLMPARKELKQYPQPSSRTPRLGAKTYFRLSFRVDGVVYTPVYSFDNAALVPAVCVFLFAVTYQ